MAGVDDLFECHVCMEHMVLKEPRVLSCLHAFCSPCLKEIMKSGEIACPTCRKSTAIPSSDVTELPLDFRLLKMWEALEKQSQPDNVPSTPDCHVCKKEPAQSKCEKCNRIFCQFCETKHDRVKLYNDHEMFDLCLKHMDSITHVCEKCNELVCTTCMLTDHGEHSEECIGYRQAVQKTKDSLLSLKKDILDNQRKTEKGKSNTETELKELESVVLQLKDRLTFYKTKAEEAEQLITAINDNVIQDKVSVKKRYGAAEITCHEVEKMLQKGMLIRGKQLFTYAENAKEKCGQTIKDVENLLQYHREIGQNMMGLERFCKIPSWIKEPIKYPKHENELQSFRQILSLDLQQSLNASQPVQISSLNYDSIALACKDLNMIVEIDVSGKQRESFYPLITGGKIHGVFCGKKKIYILKGDKITEIDRDSKAKQLYTPGLTFMSKLYVRDKQQLFIILTKYNNSVFTYLPSTRKLEKVLSGKDFPHSIVYFDCGELKKYIIGCTAGTFSPSINRLYIFDEQWKMLNEQAPDGKADGALDYPAAMVGTPGGNLLIADRYNHRISLFSHEGIFVRQVLTSVDGINEPVGVSYRSPYLWILQYDSKLKCYKEE